MRVLMVAALLAPLAACISLMLPPGGPIRCLLTIVADRSRHVGAWDFWAVQRRAVLGRTLRHRARIRLGLAADHFEHHRARPFARDDAAPRQRFGRLWACVKCNLQRLRRSGHGGPRRF